MRNFISFISAHLAAEMKIIEKGRPTAANNKKYTITQLQTNRVKHKC